MTTKTTRVRAAEFREELTFPWPDVLTLRRAIDYTGKSRATLYRVIRAGELRPASRVRGSLTFHRRELDRWLAGDPIEASDEGAAVPVISIDTARRKRDSVPPPVTHHVRDPQGAA